MRVMLSLNLADIMTSTRSATSQHVYETPNNQADRADHSEESQLANNSELMPNTTELIE